jgi:hypothetical protein
MKRDRRWDPKKIKYRLAILSSVLSSIVKTESRVSKRILYLLGSIPLSFKIKKIIPRMKYNICEEKWPVYIALVKKISFHQEKLIYTDQTFETLQFHSNKITRPFEECINYIFFLQNLCCSDLIANHVSLSTWKIPPSWPTRLPQKRPLSRSKPCGTFMTGKVEILVAEQGSSYQLYEIDSTRSRIPRTVEVRNY